MDNNYLVNKFCIWENTNIQVSDNYENEELTREEYDANYQHDNELRKYVDWLLIEIANR